MSWKLGFNYPCNQHLLRFCTFLERRVARARTVASNQIAELWILPSVWLTWLMLLQLEVVRNLKNAYVVSRLLAHSFESLTKLWQRQPFTVLCVYSFRVVLLLKIAIAVTPSNRDYRSKSLPGDTQTTNHLLSISTGLSVAIGTCSYTNWAQPLAKKDNLSTKYQCASMTQKRLPIATVLQYDASHSNRWDISQLYHT